MGALDLLIHGLNFAAPALGVAVFMLLFKLIARKLAKRPHARADSAWVSAWVQLGVNFAVGLLMLAGGLWFFGRDGMMATYGALLVGVATCQWVMNRG